MARKQLLVVASVQLWSLVVKAQWKCRPPDTPGYDFSKLGGRLTIVNFEPTGIKCAEGYLGDADALQYRACQKDDGEFQVFGCKEIVKDDGISAFGPVTINQYEDPLDCSGIPTIFSLQQTVQGFLNGSCTMWKASYDPSSTERGDGREMQVYMKFACNGTGLKLATYKDRYCNIELSNVTIGSRMVRTLHSFENNQTVRLFDDDCAAAETNSLKLGQHPKRLDPDAAGGSGENCTGWCPNDYLSCSTAVPTPVPTPAPPTPSPTLSPTPAPTPTCVADDDCRADGSSYICASGECQPSVCTNSTGGQSSQYPCKCGLTMRTTTICQLLATCTATDDTDGACVDYHDGAMCGDDAGNCCAFYKVCTNGYFAQDDPECYFTTSSGCPESWCYGCFVFQVTTTTTMTSTEMGPNTTVRLPTASSHAWKGGRDMPLFITACTVVVRLASIWKH